MWSDNRTASPDDFLSRLPPEVFSKLLTYLNTESQLALSLTSTEYLHYLADVFRSSVRDVRLVFEDVVCRPIFFQLDLMERSSFILIVTMCHCNSSSSSSTGGVESGHKRSDVIFLNAFLAVCGVHLRQVFIEDYLLNKASSVSNEAMEAVLDWCPYLETLELHDVDLSQLSSKVLARIGKLRSVNQLAFIDCVEKKGINPRLDDRLLINTILIQQNLRQLHLTQCKTVTDRALKHIARYCIRLWLANFAGCYQVTSFGVAEFCWSLADREPDLIYLKMEDTDVTGSELEKVLHAVPPPQHYLHRLPPQQRIHTHVQSRKKWVCVPFEMDFAGRRASAIQSVQLPTKTVVLFV